MILKQKWISMIFQEMWETWYKDFFLMPYSMYINYFVLRMLFTIMIERLEETQVYKVCKCTKHHKQDPTEQMMTAINAKARICTTLPLNYQLSDINQKF